MPNLSENKRVMLESCMDEIRNVVGDTVSEKQLVETIMKHNFDCAKSLDVILNNSGEASTAVDTSSAGAAATVSITTPQSAIPMETGNPKSLAIFHFHAMPMSMSDFLSNTILLLVNFWASSNFLFSFYYFIFTHLWFMI